MRNYTKSGGPAVERWTMLHTFEPVRGVTVGVCEPAENPDTVNLVILDTYEGVTVITEIDRTDPGARARAITLGEIVQDVLETAQMAWFPPEDWVYSGKPIDVG